MGARSGVGPAWSAEGYDRVRSRADVPATAEAAKLAGLSTRATYRAIQRGALRAVRLCSRARIPRDGFDEWIAQPAVRVEPQVVEVRAVPAARGSFRRLLAGDERWATS